MEKLVEHTYGNHIYMKLMINKSVHEIDVYIRENGEHYKTSGDYDDKLRKEIIEAFNELY